MSAATDAWGVGGVLFEAITGQRPSRAYGGSVPEGKDRERLRGAFLRTRRIPRDLTHLITRCLALEPAARSSVAELACGLKEVVEMRRG